MSHYAGETKVCREPEEIMAGGLWIALENTRKWNPSAHIVHLDPRDNIGILGKLVAVADEQNQTNDTQVFCTPKIMFGVRPDLHPEREVTPTHLFMVSQSPWWLMRVRIVIPRDKSRLQELMDRLWNIRKSMPAHFALFEGTTYVYLLATYDAEHPSEFDTWGQSYGGGM